MRKYRQFWKGLYIADKRGIVDFRSMRDRDDSMRDRDDGSILLVAITQKPGPKGGHTVAIGRCRPQQRTTREPESLFSR
jgi:hypothetical protein